MCRNRNALHRVSRDELIDRSTYRSRDRNVRRESGERDRELVGRFIRELSFPRWHRQAAECSDADNRRREMAAFVRLTTIIRKCRPLPLAGPLDQRESQRVVRQATDDDGSAISCFAMLIASGRERPPTPRFVDFDSFFCFFLA